MILPKLAATAALLFMYQLGGEGDASYQSTTQMTGGSLVNTIRSSQFTPKAARSVIEPTTTLTVVHGNQKAVISREHTEIYDIDRETITRIDHDKKTYTVSTFAQIRQMVKDMPKRLAELQAGSGQTGNTPPVTVKTSFDTQVQNPGLHRVVNGLPAEERIITLTTKVTGTDPGTNQSVAITYVTTTELWFAPEPPEMRDRRFRCAPVHQTLPGNGHAGDEPADGGRWHGDDVRGPAGRVGGDGRNGEGNLQGQRRPGAGSYDHEQRWDGFPNRRLCARSSSTVGAFGWLGCGTGRD